VDISIGAVGAAVIAALVSLLGLILGKEQKTSEFRQDWINKLRDELGDFGVNINAIADKLSVPYPTVSEKIAALSSHYAALNKANYAITLRLNQRETNAGNVLAAMDSFEALASDDALLKVANIKPIEKRFLEASQLLLKEEWDRVKAGEPAFRWAKWAAAGILALMTLLTIALIFYKLGSGPDAKPVGATAGQPCGITINNDGSASVVNSASGIPTSAAEPPLQPRRTDRLRQRPSTRRLEPQRSCPMPVSGVASLSGGVGS